MDISQVADVSEIFECFRGVFDGELDDERVWEDEGGVDGRVEGGCLFKKGYEGGGKIRPSERRKRREGEREETYIRDLCRRGEGEERERERERRQFRCS